MNLRRSGDRRLCVMWACPAVIDVLLAGGMCPGILSRDDLRYGWICKSHHAQHSSPTLDSNAELNLGTTASVRAKRSRKRSHGFVGWQTYPLSPDRVRLPESRPALLPTVPNRVPAPQKLRDSR